MFSYILKWSNVFSISFVSAIGSGGYFAITNRSKTSDYLFREVGEAGQDNNYLEQMDNKKYEDLKVVNREYWKLINGDSTYNNGNYVIYLGSESCSHCMGFLYGNPNLDKGNKFTEKDKMSNGTWMKTYSYTKNDSDLKDKNIKFLMYEDIPDKNLSSKDDVFWNLPWATWRQNNPEMGRWTGQYIRNDKSAINFRKIFESAQERFGKKVSGTPTVIIYKNGRAKVFNQDTLPNLEQEKQGEDMSDELQLQKFIKYYYTKIA